MKEIVFDGKVLIDLSKLVLSSSIKGIEFTQTDPGDLEDNIIYLIGVNTTNKLFLRFNALLFEIGEEVSSINN